MITQGKSAGRIEFDICFEETEDKDGKFVRCLIYSIPNYNCTIGQWMRTKDSAFKQCMSIIVKEKNVLNTVH